MPTKDKSLTQIAKTDEGAYQEKFLKRFKVWAERWDRICSDPEALKRALDRRSDDGFVAIVGESVPDWDTAKAQGREIFDKVAEPIADFDREMDEIGRRISPVRLFMGLVNKLPYFRSRPVGQPVPPLQPIRRRRY